MTAVTESSSLEDYEQRLREGHIEEVVVPTIAGAHPDKCHVRLSTGETMICKPAPPDPSGLRYAKNEVAAFRLLRDLGWADLIAVTVWRSVDVPGRGPVMSACQPLWEGAEDNTPVAQLAATDTTRAAVFDHLICQADRGGHNWLSVLGPTGRSLKLYDHAYAFETHGLNAASDFTRLHAGQPLTDEVRSALERLVAVGVSEATREMLDDDVADRLVERAKAILASGVSP